MQVDPKWEETTNLDQLQFQIKGKVYFLLMPQHVSMIYKVWLEQNGENEEAVCLVQRHLA